MRATFRDPGSRSTARHEGGNAPCLDPHLALAAGTGPGPAERPVLADGGAGSSIAMYARDAVVVMNGAAGRPPWSWPPTLAMNGGRARGPVAKATSSRSSPGPPKMRSPDDGRIRGRGEHSRSQELRVVFWLESRGAQARLRQPPIRDRGLLGAAGGHAASESLDGGVLLRCSTNRSCAPPSVDGVGGHDGNRSRSGKIPS